MPNQNSDDSIFSMIKLGLILALYAVVSCTVLALVNNFTAPKIAKNQEAKVNQAMASFFTGDEYSFIVKTDYEPKEFGSIKVDNLIIAEADGKIAGGACQVSGPTYDTATILVGMAADGTITGLQFLKNTDSPGFGLKASDSTFKMSNGKTFYGQFVGKNAKDGFVAGETFDAISGATITSNGVASLLKAATDLLFEYVGGQDE